MTMTRELANELMNALACIAIAAKGGAEIDEHGELRVSPESLEDINAYARNKFVEICNEWEEFRNEKWTIEDKPTEPTSPTCPNCGEELTFTISVETKYDCTKCGSHIFCTEGKIFERSEPIIEKE